MRSSIFCIVFAVFISYFVGNVLVPVLPLYLKYLGYTTGIIGLVVSLAAFARIPITLFAGFLADSIGKFRALAIGCTACSIAILLLLSANIYLIAIGRLVAGLFGAFIAPVLWAYATSIASRVGRTGKLVSMLNMVTNLSMVTAFALSGLLVTYLGYYLLFVLLAVLLLLAPLPVYFIKEDFVKRSSGFDIREFVRPISDIIKNYKSVILLCICCLLEWYVLNSWLMLVTLYMNSIGISKSMIGLALSIETLLYMILQLFVGHVIDKLGERSSILLLSSIAYAIILLSIPYLKSEVHIILALIGLGIASSPIFSTIFSLTSMHSPPERKGTSMGLLFMFGYIGAAVGPLMSGFLANIEFRIAFLHLAIPLTLLAMLGMVLYFKACGKQ